MKKLLSIIFMLISIVAFAQNRYSKVTTSSFKPMSYSELSNVAMTLQKRYNENQKYLYAMKNWILELKPQIKEQKFIDRLNGEYSVLTSMEDDDLARATKALKQRENSIREVISEYNSWINQQNSNTTSNQTTNTTNNVVTSKEDTPENYLQLASEFLQKENYPKAISYLSRYLENDPKNTNVLFYRAMAKGQLNDNYGAISDYEKIIENNSNYPITVAKFATVYNNKAYALVKLKKYKDALPFVNKALEIDEKEWFIWDTRGEIYFNIGKYDDAISDLSKAIKIEKHDNSYYLRGLAYIKKGNKEKGCKDLSKAGELGNGDAYEAINENCN